MTLIALIALKYLFYCLVFAAAAPLLRLPIASRRKFILNWAAFRLGMGFAFGFAIAALYIANATQNILAYVLSFGLIRVIEWSVVLLLLDRIYAIKLSFRSFLFVLIGTSINTIFDALAFAAGVDNLKLIC